jgi:bromodomain-containing factor 1
VTFSAAQHRFCLSTIRTLKKLKDAVPFLHPVDAVALNIPHYHSVIKTAMDLSTVERKLNSSNPVKPDPNPSNPRYRTADEFVSDVRVIFSNCITFNGPEHPVTAMGKRVEEVFDKQVKNMPPAQQPVAAVVKTVEITPPPPPMPAKKARRPSTSVPAIRRSDEPTGRPKREVHPPPPKDLPYADLPRKARRARSGKKDDGSVEQLKFCSKLLGELFKKQHAPIAHPFYEPVDWVKFDIPEYPRIVKKPMDLSTMRKKLDGGEYTSATKFYDDFKLMIRNCFSFNPSGSPVNAAGVELQRLFDAKWAGLPAIKPVESEDEEEEEEEEPEEEPEDEDPAARKLREYFSGPRQSSCPS